MELEPAIEECLGCLDFETNGYWPKWNPNASRRFFFRC